MTHEYSWDSDSPLSSAKAGLGYLNIQNALKMIYERMAIDHNMDNVLLPTAEQDGTHKQVTLQILDAAPDAVTGAVILYTREIDGYVEVCVKMPDDTEVLFTDESGPLYLNRPEYLKYSLSTPLALTTAYQLIEFDTEVTTENISMTDGIMTTPAAGLYLITIKAESSNGVTIQLRVNGSEAYTWIVETMSVIHVHNAGISQEIGLYAKRVSGSSNLTSAIVEIMRL